MARRPGDIIPLPASSSGMTLPTAVAEAELLFLAVLMAPAGLLVLNAGERLFRVGRSLPWLERCLVALYLTGGLLFLLASLPLGVFGDPLVIGVIAVGLIGWPLTEWRWGPPPDLRKALRSPQVPALLLVGLLFLLLLSYEVGILTGAPVANTYDGSIQALFVHLLLVHGTVPSTLLPYADMGVVYPQGTAVWLATGVVLFGWSLPEAPIYLPALFLALSVPAAFVWGHRLQGMDTPRGRYSGAVFALATAALLTWPRFLVGGSYDFLFGFPLLLLWVAWVPSLFRDGGLPWSAVVGMAVLAGILASLSVVCAEFLVVLVFVWIALGPHRAGFPWRAALSRALVITLVAMAFVLRSLWGIVEWWGYPGHTLTVMGPSPFQEWRASSPFVGSWVGLVDPFLFRPSDVWLSPFPILKVELAVLLAVGLFLLVLQLGGLYRPASRPLGQTTTRMMAVGLATGLLILSVGLLGPAAAPSLQGLNAVTNLGEVSILLFVFYGSVASLPLFWAMAELRGHFGARRDPRTVRTDRAALRPPHARHRATGIVLVASAVLVVPLATGTVVTTTQAPVYLGEIVHRLASVTPADLEALQWSSSLPSCSNVLIAPGSAAQYLPAYSDARVSFPMNPPVLNRSYWQAVDNLSWGNYTPVVAQDLRVLGITEIFVTGANNILWRPMDPAPLLAATPAIVLLYHPSGGDAYIFEVPQVVTEQSCPP